MGVCEQLSYALSSDVVNLFRIFFVDEGYFFGQLLKLQDFTKIIFRSSFANVWLSIPASYRNGNR